MQNRPRHPLHFEREYKVPSPVVFIEEKDVTLEGIKPDTYVANNIGQVYNKKSGIILKPSEINSGYLVYRLITGNKRGEGPKYKHVLSHRLFKLTFDPIENPEDYTVNHKNMDKHKNELSNLEWLTQKENYNEYIKHNFRDGSKNYRAVFSKNDLRIILNEFKKGTKYSDILKMLGLEVNKNNCDYIGNIKRGITYKREVTEILSEEVQRLGSDP